jgi:hypothetical protein
MGRGRGGGQGRRNQFYATGLTGWQRAAQADARETRADAVQHDAPAPVEYALADVVARLERLEAAGKK